MKHAAVILGLLIATSVVAADASKILLKGTSVRVEDGRVTGAARALVGDLNVSADVITFDRERNQLRCEGVVTIRVSDHLVTSKDCVIDLSAGPKKAFFLGGGEVRISTGNAADTFVPPPAGNEKSGNGRELSLEFNSRLHSPTDSNQPIEPTSGFVVPGSATDARRR